MKNLTYTMTKIRETIYSLFPQTYCLSVIYLKSNNDLIEGTMSLQLLAGKTKRINVRFDLKKDELIIKEQKEKPKVKLYCKNPNCFTHYLANNKIKEDKE